MVSSLVSSLDSKDPPVPIEDPSLKLREGVLAALVRCVLFPGMRGCQVAAGEGALTPSYTTTLTGVAQVTWSEDVRITDNTFHTLLTVQACFHTNPKILAIAAKTQQLFI